MTKKEQLKQEAKNSCIDKTHYCIGGFGGDAYCEGYIDSAEPREKRIAELELKIKHLTQHLGLQSMTALFEQVEEEVKQEQRIKELEAQIEKLTDFVLSKTECCDVCPTADTCINSEGCCPYAGILAKGEEEVTRKWLMQFISKETK